jgi:hypothetical protein
MTVAPASSLLANTVLAATQDPSPLECQNCLISFMTDTAAGDTAPATELDELRNIMPENSPDLVKIDPALARQLSLSLTTSGALAGM